MAQEDYDAWAEMDAELEKRNKAIAEFGYYNPLEDIYEGIKKIVNTENFGRCHKSGVEDSYLECYYCGARDKEKCHYTCDVVELRSLVNTLGDMID